MPGDWTVSAPSMDMDGVRSTPYRAPRCIARRRLCRTTDRSRSPVCSGRCLRPGGQSGPASAVTVRHHDWLGGRRATVGAVTGSVRCLAIEGLLAPLPWYQFRMTTGVARNAWAKPDNDQKRRIESESERMATSMQHTPNSPSPRGLAGDIAICGRCAPSQHSLLPALTRVGFRDTRRQ